MLNCQDFYNLLVQKEIRFFAGVPDSLLKDFCAYVMDHTPPHQHIITANEGGSIALATGYHLATGKFGLVYMQNSGLGNAVNPLVSLADPEVYGIPMLLLIGWRGEPCVKDEPQHVKQGRITLKMLETLEIPYSILSQEAQSAGQEIEKAAQIMKEYRVPYAFVVREGSFEKYELQTREKENFELSREKTIQIIADQLGEKDIVVSTTGKTSRELFEYRKTLNKGEAQDFLTVGSMGHASQIALGIALARPDRNVYCLDGDGAVIMHMGALAIIGQQSPKNFKHIIINNGAHDSVGGQPTAAFDIHLTQIAKGCGYREAASAQTVDQVRDSLKILKTEEGPALLEVKVNKGARKNLGRPTASPAENKKKFVEFLKS